MYLVQKAKSGLVHFPVRELAAGNHLPAAVTRNFCRIISCTCTPLILLSSPLVFMPMAPQQSNHQQHSTLSIV